MEAPFKGLAPAIPTTKPMKKNKFGDKMTIKKEKNPKMKKNSPAPMLGVYKKVK